MVIVPTAVVDLIIQAGVLLFLIYGTNMVREGNVHLYQRWGTFLILVFSYLASVFITGISVTDRERSAVYAIGNTLSLALLTWMVFNGSMAVIYELTLQGKLLALQFVLTATLMVLWHLLVRCIMARLRKAGWNHYQVVMVGSGKNIERLYSQMTGRKADKGYEVMGFFTQSPSDPVPEGARRLGTLNDIEEYIAAVHPAEMFCAISPSAHTDTVNSLVRLCEQHVIRFRYVPSMEGYPPREMEFHRIGDTTVLNLYGEPLESIGARAFKRSADLVISGLFLVTLYPIVWIICAAGIKISSPHGPVLFRQKRTGYGGKEFNCLKFRSMHANAEADTRQATKGDSRVFRFGEFLRKSSIDELPQFINVFRGDMSIIGPRPHMLHHTDVYSELIGDYMVRHLAKPGITGWAQINGCRGETRELSQMKERVAKDIWYIEHWSVDLDISIFFITIWQILTGSEGKAY